MFLTKEKVSINMSTTKVMHIAFLVTEGLLESRDFDFLKQKIIFSSPKKENVYGMIRTMKKTEVELTVSFRQWYVDLKLQFTLVTEDKWEDKTWDVQYNNISISSADLEPHVWVRMIGLSYNVVELNVNNPLRDYHRFEAFKKLLRTGS